MENCWLVSFSGGYCIYLYILIGLRVIRVLGQSERWVVYLIQNSLLVSAYLLTHQLRLCHFFDIFGRVSGWLAMMKKRHGFTNLALDGGASCDGNHATGREGGGCVMMLKSSRFCHVSLPEGITFKPSIVSKFSNEFQRDVLPRIQLTLRHHEMVPQLSVAFWSPLSIDLSTNFTSIIHSLLLINKLS